MRTIKNIYPKLSIVGAGPGNPELLTLKAIRSIESANIVLYDALVGSEILKFIPENTPKIFVGKRRNNHEYTQEQINELIVDFAFTYGHVVRLKGGDPFVFGRGGEEVQFADAFNIETEVVPGISSSVGVPGLQGIPVTHRGIAESFWVITATTSSGKISDDLYSAAQSNATIVILMGLSKLNSIIKIFSLYGKSNIPVAVIQNGSLPNEKIALGTISSIEQIVKEKNIEAPAVIVIGDVVSLHPEYQVQKAFTQNVKNESEKIKISAQSFVINYN